MKISEYIKSSLDASDRKELEQALMFVCMAIDGTAKKLYPTMPVGQRFCKFINDNIKMKNSFIVIVHGIGSGILKETTQKTLAINKKVIEYKIYPFNVGCTIAKIDLTK